MIGFSMLLDNKVDILTNISTLNIINNQSNAVTIDDSLDSLTNTIVHFVQ